MVRHHLVDVLVRAGDFVQHAFVFPAHHALGLRLEIFDRERLLRRIAAHAAPGAVRAGVEALRRAAAAHDVAARPHASRDDAELAFARADSALAREPDAFAEMKLSLDVIVMAVHRRFGRLEGGQMAMHRVQHQLDHLGAVRARVVLRPADRLDVIIEMLRALGKVRQVAVRELQLGSFRVALGELDEVGADGVADAAASRVQHHPDAVRLVQAHLDEVIAAAERAELMHPARVPADALLDAGMLCQDARQAAAEVLRRLDARVVVLVLLDADRDVAGDLVKHLAQGRLVEVVGGERQPRGDHAAADVDTDRRRDDRLERRNHRSHCRANPQMHVGHRCHMVVDDRQPGDVDELRTRDSLHLAGVNLHRHAAFGDLLEDRHRLF